MSETRVDHVERLAAEIEARRVVWTFALVEERLVEAMCQWRRSPGDGKSPFAKDGPWHLIKPAAGDWGKLAVGETSSDIPLRPLPLVRREVGERDEASTWLSRFVDEELDRRIVVMALGYKAAAHRVPWRSLLPRLGLDMGADGLRRRYERAIHAIAKGLDREQRAARTAQL